MIDVLYTNFYLDPNIIYINKVIRLERFASSREGLWYVKTMFDVPSLMTSDHYAWPRGQIKDLLRLIDL